MDSLISTINKLQDVFNTVQSQEIQLPQIVVVGSQSAGKSSVIESIVGLSFLPRGIGIVTRCPLVLQLTYCPLHDDKIRSELKGTSELEAWGEFLHTEDKIWDDFDDIREEIEAQTDVLAGENKGICMEAITLKIYSAKVVNLTLVDLPGIVKVPVGDQPADIEEQVKELILGFISNRDAIILAVSPANIDLATSEALKIAKEIDPDGIRTLAVLTKLDLMDKGTNALDVLSGRVIPVQLGIIGVVNLSYQDTIDNHGIDYQIQKEKKFLKENYPKVADSNGTAYLAKTLNRLLMNHIQECLPELKKRIANKTDEVQEELSFYGQEVEDKNAKLFSIITEFSVEYCAMLSGGFSEFKRNHEKTKIYSILHESLGKDIWNIKPDFKELATEELTEILSQPFGPRPTLFNDPIFDHPFETIVKKQIILLKDPLMKCVDRVLQEMTQNIGQCGFKDMKRFPRLKEKINQFVSNLLKSKASETKKVVENLIETELAYINKNHPNFKKEAARLLPSKNDTEDDSEDDTSYYVPTVPQKMKSMAPHYHSMSQEDKNNFDILERLVMFYFDVVRTSMTDLVPKNIMNILVNNVMSCVQMELFSHLYNPGAHQLLNESAKIVMAREKATEMFEALIHASQIMNEISEDVENWD